MNSVSLLGRMVKDVEIQKTNGGKSVAKFSLAVQKPYKNDKGGYDADYINCVAFDGRAENIATYVHQGDQFAFTGRLNTRNYESKDGHKVYVTEVIVDSFDFISNRKPSAPVQEEFSQVVDAVEEKNLPFN